MKLKKCVFMVSLLLFTQRSFSISQSQVYMSAGASALAVSIVFNKLSPDFLKPLILPLTAVGTFYYTEPFFSQFTPYGRIERATNQLHKVGGYRLARVFFETKEQLYEAIYGLYVSETWPLIAAVNELGVFVEMCSRVTTLANAAQAEDGSLENQAEVLKDSAENYARNMKNSIKLIRESKEYLEQLDQYKEEQRHKEQMQVQYSMASAQWSSANAQHQIATAQKEVMVTPAATSSQNYNSNTSGGEYITMQYDYVKADLFTENQAFDYIAQHVAAMNVALASKATAADINCLQTLIQDSVSKSQYVYQTDPGVTYAGKLYKKDVIDQFIGSAVLGYIETTSYTIAYNNIHDETISQSIAELMRNNALVVIAQSRVVNYEKLAPFVGYALEKAINDIIQQKYSNTTEAA